LVFFYNTFLDFCNYIQGSTSQFDPNTSKLQSLVLTLPGSLQNNDEKKVNLGSYNRNTNNSFGTIGVALPKSTSLPLLSSLPLSPLLQTPLKKSREKQQNQSWQQPTEQKKIHFQSQLPLQKQPKQEPKQEQLKQEQVQPKKEQVQSKQEQVQSKQEQVQSNQEQVQSKQEQKQVPKQEEQKQDPKQEQPKQEPKEEQKQQEEPKQPKTILVDQSKQNVPLWRQKEQKIANKQSSSATFVMVRLDPAQQQPVLWSSVLSSKLDPLMRYVPVNKNAFKSEDRLVDFCKSQSLSLTDFMDVFYEWSIDRLKIDLNFCANLKEMIQFWLDKFDDKGTKLYNMLQMHPREALLFSLLFPSKTTFADQDRSILALAPFGYPKNYSFAQQSLPKILYQCLISFKKKLGVYSFPFKNDFIDNLVKEEKTQDQEISNLKYLSTLLGRPFPSAFYLEWKKNPSKFAPIISSSSSSYSSSTSSSSTFSSSSPLSPQSESIPVTVGSLNVGQSVYLDFNAPQNNQVVVTPNKKHVGENRKQKRQQQQQQQKQQEQQQKEEKTEKQQQKQKLPAWVSFSQLLFNSNQDEETPTVTNTETNKVTLSSNIPTHFTGFVLQQLGTYEMRFFNTNSKTLFYFTFDTTPKTEVSDLLVYGQRFKNSDGQVGYWKKQNSVSSQYAELDFSGSVTLKLTEEYISVRNDGENWYFHKFQNDDQVRNAKIVFCDASVDLVCLYDS
jgi:hypothetical protein